MNAMGASNGAERQRSASARCATLPPLMLMMLVFASVTRLSSDG
jgi:hypothetical protein